jgi:diaminohydroxyphosphoribosylaminopyrimidine deaminase/5-amino-6-(5-phosphoribosylamino)uracil reductase
MRVVQSISQTPARFQLGYYYVYLWWEVILISILDDEVYMRLALQLAESTQGQTGINPVVGCVVVKDGRIVGTGAHLKRGGPHAEVHALDMAGIEAKGSTVYVTLEPCSHHGRTPPCADRLITEKVERVVVAARDPNPQVAGSGLAKLQAQGIKVEQGLLESESRALNESFETYMLTGMPFVTMKSAVTLDGKIAAKSGDSKWISSADSREQVHTMRHKHQAILVGIGTVLADNPSLTTRLSVPGLSPIRIVVDSQLRLPEHAALLQGAGVTNQVYVLTTRQASEERAQRLEQIGATILRCGDQAHVDLHAAMRRLGELEIGSILLEGGGKLSGAMLESGLINKVVLYIAPIIVGGREAPSVFDFDGYSTIREACRLDKLQIEQIGGDICVSGYPIQPVGGDLK